MYMPSSGGDGTTLGTDVSALATVMLVLSHVLIAAAVPFLVLAHLYYPASWALAVLVVSDIYHIARSSGTAFGMAAATWRILDHAVADAATAALVFLALKLDRGGGASGNLARTFLPIVCIYAVLAFPFQPQSLVVVVTFVLVVAADKWLRVNQMHSSPPLAPGVAGVDEVDWRLATGGSVAAACGLALFYMPDSAYPETHPLWHLFIGVAFLCWALAFSQHRHRTLALFSQCVHADVPP